MQYKETIIEPTERGIGRQTTQHILMVRPNQFGYNPETAASNAFQVKDDTATDEIAAKAIEEFDAFVAKLRGHGINVIVAQDPAQPHTPDAVFPNNWVTFHENGTVMLYPMLSATRRLERQPNVLETVYGNFQHKRVIDLSPYESRGQFLEGTGSMILDRVNRLVYACISPRTEPVLLDEFCEWAGYEKVEFRAVDENGLPIYHTNVMMAMGDKFAIICMATVADKRDKAKLLKRFAVTGKKWIDISIAQMKAFAGNMLQVENDKGQTFLIMSEQAYRSLRPAQITAIEKYTTILHSPIYTIEKYGGGSARCMMAEIFLPVVIDNR